MSKLCSQNIVVVLALFSLTLASRRAEAQSSETCSTDRVVSTLVGAGLGAAAGAIPATMVHRHDQTSSHRIVIGSVTVGALAGLVAASRDRPCASHRDSSRIGEMVVAKRSTRAGRGALVGVVIGGVLGAAGSTLYQTGCMRDPCHEGTTRMNLMLFTAAEGAVAGGLLGSLIGWALPVGR